MTTVTGNDADRGLSRSIGTRQLAASIVNVTIGGGVFLLPAFVAGSLGGAAWLAYVIGAVAFAFIVATFAEAGSRVSMSGGPYAWVEHAFGPFVGYLCGALILIFGTIAHAAVASGFTQVVNALVPGAGSGLPRAALLVLVFALFTVINLRGVKAGARTAEIGAVAKLAPLLFLFIAGWFVISPPNLAWPGMPEAKPLFRTSMQLMFAYFGVESALVPSGEVKEPHRTVPRAILLAIGVVSVLYIGLQLVSQGILGADLAKYSDAPLGAAAGKGFGEWAGVVLIAGAAVSMMGHCAGMMLAMPRQLFAFASDGYLPSALARVNPRTQVPTLSIVVYAAIVCTLAVSGTFASLILLANITALVMYLLCCLGVLQLRRKGIRMSGEPLRLPGGAALPWIGSAFIVVLLSTMTLGEVKALAILLALATLLYFVRQRVR